MTVGPRAEELGEVEHGLTHPLDKRRPPSVSRVPS